MPELPEVHGYQTYIDSTCLNQTIIALDCRDPRLLKQSFSDFENHLIGKQLTGTKRIGKYLFIRTSGEKILVLHFGMTGRPNYYKEAEARPKFGHIVLTFDTGFHFAFENKRKFGWWDLTESIELFQKSKKLSKDARDLTLDEFMAAVTHRKTTIKQAIMNQSITAGVGNWMADEILFQSKIHPEKKIPTMTTEEIKMVYQSMQEVIETAIRLEAHYASFPKNYLIHARKGEEICPETGGEIKKIKVGGRTTYFSPNWQQL